MTVTTQFAECRTVGDRVNVLCDLHEVSNAELARVVGCSAPTIGHIRHNKVKNPRSDFLDSIAKYFDVDDRWLRTGVPRDEEDGHQGRSDFQVFMRTVSQALTDPDDIATVTRAVRLVLEDLERRRLTRKSPRQTR